MSCFSSATRAGLLLLTLSGLGCSNDEQSAAPTTNEKPSSSIVTSPSPAAKKYHVVETFNVGKDVYVRSMVADTHKGSLWVGTSVGVLEVDLTSHDMLGSYTRADGLANEYVFGMLVDHKGNRWFGTNGGGISRFSTDGKWKTYFPMHGLADYWVYSFAEQSDGTLWIGTWAGLSHFDPATGSFNNYVQELVNEWVYGLGVDSKDHVWIGTEGGINMFDGKQWFTWTHKDGLGAANADNLPISTNTGLGTRSRHDLSVLTKGQETYNPNYVFSLVIDANDGVWAGTWGGGVAHFKDGKWTNYTTKNGLAGNIVYSTAKDSDGGLWFGTNNGLSHFDGKNWQTYTMQDGLLENNAYAIVPVSDGKVWVGTRSGVVLMSK